MKMKKTKLLAALILSLSFVLLLSSCSFVATGRFNLVFDKETFVYEPNNPAYKNLTELSYQDYTMSLISSNLLWFNKDDKHVIYNTVMKQSVFEITGKNISFDGNFNTFWMIKGEKVNEYDVTLYLANGTELDSKNKTGEEPECVLDLVYFNGTCYRFTQDGALEESFEYGTFAEFPSLMVGNGEYYYDGYGNNDSITVYDDRLNVVSYFEIPSYAEESQFMVLDNGNILLQYAVLEAEDAEDYTVLLDGAKYTIVTKILKVKNGNEKEIKVDYLFLDMGGGYSRSVCEFVDFDLFDGFKSSIKNVLIAAEIVDQRVNDEDMKIYSVSNDGKAKLVLNDMYTGQGDDLPVPVAVNRYTIDNEMGQTLLLDEKGKVIKDISNAKTKGTYLYTDEAIYDYNLNELYNYKAAGMEGIYAAAEGCILFTKGENVHLFVISSGETRDLGSALKVDYNSLGNVFTVEKQAKNGVSDFEVYNSDGALISTISVASFMGARSVEGGLILRGYSKDGKSVYYFVTE